jgi:colicin import membrane protein
VRFNRLEPGLVLSSVAHAALLAVAVVGLWTPRSFEDHQEAIPVEVVTEDQLRQMTRGEREAKKPDPEAKPRADRVAEAVERKPDAPKAETDIVAPAGPTQAEKDAEARAEAETKVRAEADAKARAEAQAAARAAAAAQAAEARAAEDRAASQRAAASARQAAAEKAAAEKAAAERAAEQERRAAETKAAEEAEERRQAEIDRERRAAEAKRVAEAKAAADARARREAEAKALRETIEREQQEAEERKEAAAEQARRAAEAKRAADERARKAAEAKAAEAKAQEAKAAAEARASEEKAKREAEAKAAAARRLAEAKPFNPTDISRLLENRQPAQSTGSTGPQPQRQAALGTPTGAAPKLSPSDREALIDFLRAKMRECISVPPGSNRNARPEVRVLLARDGSLAAPPAIVGGDRAIGEAAVRGIRGCAPYRIPARFMAQYEDWRSMIITIDASDLN